MKRILFGIAAVIFTVGAANAQSDKKYPNAPDTIGYQTSSNHPDGYMMKNGKMMCVKDQKMTLLKNDTTLTNGTIIMNNGNFIRTGGTKTMFKEGQHMDLKGKMMMMSGSNDLGKTSAENKKMYLVKDTTRNERNPE